MSTIKRKLEEMSEAEAGALSEELEAIDYSDAYREYQDEEIRELNSR